MATVFQKEVIDANTGEVIKAVAFIPEAKDRGFVKVFKLFGKKVLEDLGALNGEAKLLIWFLAKTLELPVQSDLWIPVDYKEVAKELKISEVSVKRYTKKLIDLGYLEQFKNRHTTFRLNPDFIYKGVLTKYKEDTIKEVINNG